MPELSVRLWSILIGSQLPESRRLLLYRVAMLLLTFIIYANFRVARRPLAIVKSVLHNDSCVRNSTQPDCGFAPFDGPSGKQLLGYLDSIFLFVYAGATFLSGYIAERTNKTWMLASMNFISAFILFAFGLAKNSGIHQFWYFVFLQIVFGFFQAGIAPIISVVGEWFGNTKKGTIFGLWAWHTSVGNMIGSAVAGIFVDTDWAWSFYSIGIISMIVGLLILCFLVPRPDMVGLRVEKAYKREEYSDIDSGSGEEQQEAITVWKAIQIPGVVEFAACLFFTKLVSYTFLYWLPYYLKGTGKYTPSSSAFASILFDIGGCLGALLCGAIADYTSTSGSTVVGFLLTSTITMLIYASSSFSSEFVRQILLMIIGASINGPFTMIVSTVSANLGCRVPSQAAMATVSALINGTGSIGAAVGPSIAGLLSQSGWMTVFYAMIVSNLIGSLMLSRVCFQEFRIKFFQNAIEE